MIPYSDGAGKGASFSVFLPTCEPPPMYISTLPLDGSPKTSFPRLRILFVEDNQTTNKIMERLLNRLGHQVFTAFR